MGGIRVFAAEYKAEYRCLFGIHIAVPLRELCRIRQIDANRHRVFHGGRIGGISGGFLRGIGIGVFFLLYVLETGS